MSISEKHFTDVPGYTIYIYWQKHNHYYDLLSFPFSTVSAQIQYFLCPFLLLFQDLISRQGVSFFPVFPKELCYLLFTACFSWGRLEAVQSASSHFLLFLSISFETLNHTSQFFLSDKEFIVVACQHL